MLARGLITSRVIRLRVIRLLAHLSAPGGMRREEQHLCRHVCSQKRVLIGLRIQLRIKLVRGDPCLLDYFLLLPSSTPARICLSKRDSSPRVAADRERVSEIEIEREWRIETGG